ncbi:MAG: benzoate 1,2-dioxygenase small subunit [Bosea sp. (in: a-proteobacteria)]|jgi:benzoate/toluate 1,2-dioxygenase beta subunit|uniref:benzoate 1,2-dioxygenase small subunit n=1 Tax=Bosea sp. (in: a-proteobacteria) TaxID=1871050 RepID=UPI0022BC6A09|nr:benzoate 1,2-dioxygenase small subunit [Bosea sp. (in: a-proteobacteria)]MCZ8042736.1 benzoate 1,2-dioxygenase small subunit [Beijerinckiaceae bacterium]MDP3601681.1 benzoate 1,2-dioxygenase small subunit [Bosea sp. (in: a-proteobacteria)]WRH58403.1 MAG: benzoate 1,2-dioxygenase small subunit [Bosea sp. (in: a-proteobacteria)]
MSLAFQMKTRPQTVSLEEVQTFLYAEARALDDREWDAWLACYAPDATFHMPAWDDDDLLTEDPQREISLIYYGSKQGLEDRVFRIRTERSSATSLPEPRTSHNISNVEIVEETAGQLKVRFNWFNLSYRYKTTDTYFGTSYYTIDTSGECWLIKAKKVVFKNDYIHHVVDIYHI